jgi:hypothetical protein
MVGDRGIHQDGTSSYKEEHHRYHEYDDVCGEARTVIAFGFGLMTVSGHLVPSCLRKLILREFSQPDCCLQCSISHPLTTFDDVV